MTGSPLILASPASAPGGYVEPSQGLAHRWTGWDGSVWDLNDIGGGVLLTNEGVEGMHFPKIQKQKSRSRAVPGARTRGWQADVRSVFWPLFIWGNGSTEWLTRNEAFMSTIHPDKPGTWTVSAGDNARSLDLTGVFDSSHAFVEDPSEAGWALYPTTLEADQPYWRGKPITRGPWKATSGRPFFPVPPPKISSGNVFGSAQMPNVGDIDIWATWRAVGPLSDIQVGVSGAVINVPFSIGSASLLEIDTDPRNPTAKLNGIDVTRQLGMQDYAPIPQGDAVPIVVNATGTGWITCTATPLYFRAFGTR